MDKNEIEYAYQLKERKRDAKIRMQQASKVVNGEYKINNYEIIGSAKSRKK